MEIADLLDAALRLYRHNFLALLEIAAVVYVPLAVIAIVIQYLAFSLMLGAGEEVPVAALSGLGLFCLIYLAASSLLYPLGQGALATGISEVYLGRKISLRRAYRRVWPLWWKLLLTMILVGLVTGVGTLFCLVPGVVFWIWFIAATPIVAIEQLWGPEAMSRSYNLVTGHGWRVFGTLLLLGLMLAIVYFAVLLPANIVVQLIFVMSPVLGQIVSQIIGAVLQTVFGPVAMIAVVLIYYDLRIRKEGFDLVMMAQELQRQVPGRPEAVPESLFTSGVPLPPRPTDDNGTSARLPQRPPQGGTDYDQRTRN